MNISPLYHFIVSFVLLLICVRHLRFDITTALFLSLLVVSTIGLFKEFTDPVFDYTDLTADMLGMLLAIPFIGRLRCV
jgi:hypothetical protein